MASVQVAQPERRARLLISRRSWVRAPPAPPAVLLEVLIVKRAVEADPARAGSDMLKRLPPLAQQRETALAQAAHRANQRVPCPGINIELPDPGGLLHRDIDAVTSAFVCPTRPCWENVIQYGRAAVPVRIRDLISLKNRFPDYVSFRKILTHEEIEAVAGG